MLCCMWCFAAYVAQVAYVLINESSMGITCTMWAAWARQASSQRSRLSSLVLGMRGMSAPDLGFDFKHSLNYTCHLIRCRWARWLTRLSARPCLPHSLLCNHYPWTLLNLEHTTWFS